MIGKITVEWEKDGEEDKIRVMQRATEKLTEEDLQLLESTVNKILKKIRDDNK